MMMHLLFLRVAIQDLGCLIWVISNVASLQLMIFHVTKDCLRCCKGDLIQTIFFPLVMLHLLFADTTTERLFQGGQKGFSEAGSPTASELSLQLIEAFSEAVRQTHLC